MNVQEIEAKSILVKSKLPDTDFVVNPYTGCQFACQYCYASFMGRFVGEPVANWGNYVYVKANAVSLFAAEIRRLRAEDRTRTILLSSVTDSYHGIEKKYRLTRGILEVLAAADYSGRVSVLTKSPLVLRDVDVLKRLRNAEVGLTVTTTDDALSGFLETHAPPASRRLYTLEKLNTAGIATYCFVGPLLPHFRYRPELLDELFSRIAQTGTTAVYIEHINLKKYIRDRLSEFLGDTSPEIRAIYREARTDEHRRALDGVVLGLVKKHGLRLRLGMPLYHEDLQTAP
jgi:DNA repair photolyase